MRRSAVSPIRSPLRVAAVVLALLPCAAGAAPSDWTSFRGGDGTGAVSTGREQPVTGLAAVWQHSIGSAYSGLTPAGDVVLTCAARDGRDLLVALDAGTGAERWAVDLAEMTPGRGGSLDGSIATPTVADGVAYAFSPRGPFVAVDVTDGRELWRRDLAEEDAAMPYYGFASSPIVHGDLVIVQIGGEAGSVVALEKGTGEIAWRAGSATVEAQSPMIATIDGRTQVVVSTNEWVGALDPQEGTVLWTWPYEASAGFVLTTSPIVLPDGRVFFTPSTERGVMLRPPSLEGNRPAGEEGPTAEVLWEANALTRTYSPAALIGDALVGYTSRFLAAYAAADGELLWRSRDPGDGFLIGVDGRALVITKDGSLHLGDVEGAWNELAALQLFDEIVWTPPAYDAALDAVYVRSMTGIARVDLVREAVRTTEVERTRNAVSTAAVPAVLAALVAAPEAGRGAAVDEFLEGVRTPILADGRALFLWRGEADDVGISGDFLGMRVEAPFRRLEGTDLWWYETEIDPRLQYVYYLYVDLEPTLDPLNPVVEANTMFGYNANWTREPIDMSWFAGPEWAGPPEHLGPASGAPEPLGAIAERLRAEPEGVTDEERERFGQFMYADVWLPPGYDSSERRYPVVFVMDYPGLRVVPDMPGPPQRELSRWGDTLRRMAGESFEEAIVVFLGGPAVTAELVATLDETYRTDPGRMRRAMIGWHFRSNAIFNTLRQAPELVGRFAVQSYLGFFGDEVDGALAAMREATEAGHSFVGYMDWGVLDARSPSEGWDMGASSAAVFEGLRALGIEMHGGEVADTTDWKSWRNRTHEMLGALFPPTRD